MTSLAIKRPDQPPSPRGAKEVGAKVDAQQTMGCLVCSYNVARVCIVWLYADVCMWKY